MTRIHYSRVYVVWFRADERVHLSYMSFCKFELGKSSISYKIIFVKIKKKFDALFLRKVVSSCIRRDRADRSHTDATWWEFACVRHVRIQKRVWARLVADTEDNLRIDVRMRIESVNGIVLLQQYQYTEKSLDASLAVVA